MALSSKLKKEIKNAIGDKIRADELIAAIEASVASPAANVALFGATTALTALVATAANISAITGTYVDTVQPTGAEINTVVNGLRTSVNTKLDLKADNADVETLRTEAEARLDDIETKINAIIDAMTDAGLMTA